MTTQEKQQTAHRNKRSIGAFLRIMTIYPTAWIGFAFVCAWPWMSASIMLTYGDIAHTGTPVWLGSTLTFLVMAACGFAVGFIFQNEKLRPILDASTIVAVICYLTSSILFLLLCKMPSNELDVMYYGISIVWALLAGIGQAFLFISWVKSFGLVGPRKAIALVLASSIACASLILIFNQLPQNAKELLFVIDGVAAGLCALSLEKTFRKKHPEPAPQLENLTFFSSTQKMIRPPWKLLITAVVAGASFRVFQNLSFLGAFGETAWYTFGAAGLVLAALLFTLVSFVLRMNFNHMIYRFSFVLMATGCLMCAIAIQSPEWGYSLFCAGYHCFEMLVWCLCSYFVYYRNVSPNWLGGLCVGSLMTGRFLGSIFLFVSQSNFFEITMSATVAILMFALMLTALMLANNRNLLEVWGMAKPGDTEDESKLISLCCARLSKQFSLTKRENEVLEHLVRGATRASISQQLVLSEETIKTHIRHIYQKCDVHSRAELDELVKPLFNELKHDQLELRSQDAVG